MIIFSSGPSSEQWKHTSISVKGRPLGQCLLKLKSLEVPINFDKDIPAVHTLKLTAARIVKSNSVHRANMKDVKSLVSQITGKYKSVHVVMVK